jgi:hypothetical protein
MATAEGAYRCRECKTWKHLMAWAAANVEGPLDERGQLIRYDYVDDCYLYDDSIHCTRHLDAGVEQFWNGRWCRWWQCPTCAGKQRIGQGGRYPCPYGIRATPGTGHWDGKLHSGWLPAREAEALRAAGQTPLPQSSNLLD